jgi:pentachlorophenol monooxygenase
VFEGIGVLNSILDAAVQMFGQIVYVNGDKVAQVEFATPADVPFGFIAIPQYATERILREELAMHGVHVERGRRVGGFKQDAHRVTVTLDGDVGEQTVRAGYLIGADGAHSIVRKTLDLTFEGAAFEEQYMLGDVEVDWSVPRVGRCGRCTRSTARPTTCWWPFRCPAGDATGCRCWCPTTSRPAQRPPTG